jgi:hypothetical protein
LSLRLSLLFSHPFLPSLIISINMWHFIFSKTDQMFCFPNSLLLTGSGVIYRGEKRTGREAEHSRSSSAEVKNEGSYNSATPICLHDVETSVTKYVRFKVLRPAKI